MPASPCARLAVPLLLAAAVASSGCAGRDTATIDDRPPPAAPTTAATPSVPAADTVEADLAAAQEAYYQAYVAALGAPGDAHLVANLLGLYTAGSVERGNVERRMASFAERGVAGRPGPDSYYVIENVEVLAGSLPRPRCGHSW